MTTVHAVCLSYWPNRRDNVYRIVNDLLAGSVVPDHITIMDNNPHDEWFRGEDEEGVGIPEDERVGIVVSTTNTWTRGKFVAALLHPAKYYLMMDDDTSVGPRTVERLLEWSAGRRGLVTGYWGVRLSPDNKFIAGASIIQPNHQIGAMQRGAHSGVPVDGFHGRAMWMSYDAVVRMLAVEEFVRFDENGDIRWGHEGDDILAGLANPPMYEPLSLHKEESVGTGSYVIPLQGDEQFVDLSEEGQALQYQPGYFDERDAFCQEAVEVIKDKGIPWW